MRAPAWRSGAHDQRDVAARSCHSARLTTKSAAAQLRTANGMAYVLHPQARCVRRFSPAHPRIIRCEGAMQCSSMPCDPRLDAAEDGCGRNRQREVLPALATSAARSVRRGNIEPVRESCVTRHTRSTGRTTRTDRRRCSLHSVRRLPRQQRVTPGIARRQEQRRIGGPARRSRAAPSGVTTTTQTV